jgi:hypothetical protein
LISAWLNSVRGEHCQTMNGVCTQPGAQDDTLEITQIQPRITK